MYNKWNEMITYTPNFITAFYAGDFLYVTFLFSTSFGEFVAVADNMKILFV